MATLSASVYLLGPAALVWSIPGTVFWPYFSGIVIFFLGLAVLAKEETETALGFSRVVRLGPLFFAVAMAIFGADHLVAAKFVAMLVPSWMPARLFWAYFVGFALTAAALGLVTRVQWRLAAAMLGIMIFMFVLMIHLPNWVKKPGLNIPLTILVRDMSLSAGALAFGVSGTNQRADGFRLGRFRSLAPGVIFVARFAIALAMVVFGIDQILNPSFAPGIPQENPALVVTMPAWIPAHALWARLSGVIFLACALGMTIRKQTRLAATTLGLTVMLLIVFVYLPLTIARAADIASGLNYLAIHFALAGSAFFLASAMPVNAASEASREESEMGSGSLMSVTNEHSL